MISIVLLEVMVQQQTSCNKSRRFKKKNQNYNNIDKENVAWSVEM